MPRFGFGVCVLFTSFYIFKSCKPKVRNYVLLLFPLMVILNLVFLYQFSYGPLESWLDRVLSFRFSYVCPVLQNSSVTLFGNPTFFTRDSEPFDNSYAAFLLSSGSVGASIFLLSVFLGVLKNSKNLVLLSMCSTVCLIGLIESRMGDLTMSFPLIKILLDGWDLRREENLKH